MSEEAKTLTEQLLDQLGADEAGSSEANERLFQKVLDDASQQSLTEEELINFLICDFIESYGEFHEVETKWREPVIGIADAHDPMYQELKTIVDPFHSLPNDLVEDAQSVIVYFAPFSEEIVKSNIPDEESSREWDYACIETNNMLADLSDFLYHAITGYGYSSSNMPPTYNYDPVNLTSEWSHRSSGYIAGIGTFGMNHMFITDQGCCGRMGSVITGWKLKPTPRSGKENCLFRRNGTCGACAMRCSNHALIPEDGTIRYDGQACNEQIYEKIVPQYPIGIGDACGKCMVSVPCALRNPCKNLD